MDERLKEVFRFMTWNSAALEVRDEALALNFTVFNAQRVGELREVGP